MDCFRDLPLAQNSKFQCELLPPFREGIGTLFGHQNQNHKEDRADRNGARQSNERGWIEGTVAQYTASRFTPTQTTALTLRAIMEFTRPSTEVMRSTQRSRGVAL